MISLRSSAAPCGGHAVDPAAEWAPKLAVIATRTALAGRQLAADLVRPRRRRTEPCVRRLNDDIEG
jgi:hypothetical protein